jgi:hypothetical protein
LAIRLFHLKLVSTRSQEKTLNCGVCVDQAQDQWASAHLCTQEHASRAIHLKDVFITMNVLIAGNWRKVNDQK